MRKQSGRHLLFVTPSLAIARHDRSDSSSEAEPGTDDAETRIDGGEASDDSATSSSSSRPSETAPHS